MEKIKTIGSTYMAATGLNASPGPEYAAQVGVSSLFALKLMHGMQGESDSKQQDGN